MPKEYSFQNHKLSKTLIFLLFSISIIITLFQVLYTFNSDYNKVKKEAENSLKQVEITHLDAINLALWQLDYKQLSILVKGASKLPYISYIQVEEDGKKIIKTGQKNSEYTIEKEFELKHSDFPDKVLGKLYIQASYKKDIKIIYEKVVENLFQELLKVFILAFGLIWIVHKLILKHLIRMSKYVINLDSKNLSTPLKLKKRENKYNQDAIDVVANAINTMRKNLLDDIKEKEQHEKNLQEEIDVRKKIEKEALEQARRIQKQYNTIVELSIYENLFEKSFLEGIETISKYCLNTLHVDAVRVWKLEAEHLESVNIYAKNENLYKNTSLKIPIKNLPVFMEYIKKDQYIDAVDVYKDKRTIDFDKENMKNIGIQSMLDIAIFFHNKLYGFICFDHHKTDKKWSQDEIAFASRISDQISNLLTINQYKSAKEEIEKINTSLEANIQTRTRELQESILHLKKTQDQLVQNEKMASLGSLVAGVAHEINTPVGISLTGISHFQHITNEIKNEYENKTMTQEKFENYLESATQIANSIFSSLSRAAKQIKSFKQVAVDQSNEELRKFYVKNYLEEIIVSLHSRLKQTQHSIKIDCDKDITIYSYPGAISQIFTNFIMNSIIHAFKETKKGKINISVYQEDDTILIHYKDNGTGIEQKNIKNIFDPFFTTNREKGGTGLGLNIVYNIVKTTLQGEIECESQFGKGVNFYLKFPKNLKGES